MPRRSPLDDPRTSAHAWARYRRVLKGMGALTLVIVAATLGAFYWSEGFVSVHFFIAAGLGIGLTMMLTAALMGLIFLSSGTGHDEAVAEFEDGDQVPGAGRKR